MKTFLPIAIAALALASCSTAYKSGQTPDDVYFSPQRPAVERAQNSQDEYVRMDNNRSGKYGYTDEDNYDDYYLRMKVRNRDRWAMLDNNLYFNNYIPSYGMGIGMGYNPYMAYNPYFGSSFNNYYNAYSYGFPTYSYFGLGGYYNPYASYGYGGGYGYNPYSHQVIINNPRGPVYNRPRTSNLNVYNLPQNSSSNPRGRTRTLTLSDDNYNSNPTNRSRNSGNELRNTFNNNSNNNSFQNSAPSRPASTPSSSSGGGSAPSRRF